MEAEFFQAGDNLTEFGIGKLAGYRRSDYGIELVAVVLLALFQQVNHIENIGLIRNRAERTLVNTCAAGNTLVVVDCRRFVLVHRDCLDLAGILTGALAADDRGVRANLGAGAAFLAL